MRPLLKWAGNKVPLAPQIAGHLFPDGPDLNCDFVSPFLGAGGFELYALANGLVDPKRCRFSDVNERLIGFWRAIRDEPEGVIHWLRREPTDDGEEWRKAYAKNRDRFNRRYIPPAAMAALLIWLNRAGYNGLYRENRKGEFNVPIGKPPGGRLSLPTDEHIREVSRLIQDVGFACVPWSVALVSPWQHTAGRIYADPPYVPAKATSSFTAYVGGGFSAADQADLSRVLAEVPAAAVVASNSVTPLVEELYGEPTWRRHRVEVRRSISAKSGGRGKVGEYLLVRS